MAAQNPDQFLMEEADKPLDWKHYLFLVRKNVYIILTFVIIAITLSVIYASKIADRYLTSTQIMIEKPESAKPVNSLEGGPEGISYTEDYYTTQIEIMRSPTVLNQVVRELRLKDYYAVDNEELIGDRIRSMMAVKRIGISRLFNITITAEEPKLAVSLANSIARSYIRKNFEDTLYYSKEILAWLPQQGSPGEKISIQDPFGKMQQITREELIESLPVIQTDETLRALKEKSSALESDLKLLLKQYREKHPLVIRARANLKFIDDSIEAERTRIIDSLKTQAEGRHRLGAARIIEEARLPKEPLPNSRIKIIIAAGLGALFISVLIIILLDYFDDTIHSLNDFERKGLVNLPFLGPIPFVKGKVVDPEHRALAGYYAKQSNIAEAFRYLRVAINFSASPEQLKTLVLSSCLPHEGKSFV